MTDTVLSENGIELRPQQGGIMFRGGDILETTPDIENMRYDRMTGLAENVRTTIHVKIEKGFGW